MLTAQYALNLEKEGFTCFAISPGVSLDLRRTQRIRPC